jgi:hypothetical protein
MRKLKEMRHPFKGKKHIHVFEKILFLVVLWSYDFKNTKTENKQEIVPTILH